MRNFASKGKKPLFRIASTNQVSDTDSEKHEPSITEAQFIYLAFDELTNNPTSKKAQELTTFFNLMSKDFLGIPK